MNTIIKFILTYLFTFIVYLLVFIVPVRRKRKKNKKYKEILEIKYLVSKYGLKLKSINYNQLLWIVCFVSSLDITIIVCLVLLLDIGYFLQLLVAFVLVIPIFMFSYKLISLYYKKKGMIKDV